MKLSRRGWYKPDPAVRQAKADAPLIDALNVIIAAQDRWGFWTCFYRLKQLGYIWNHQRIWRVDTAMRLNQKWRTKKRLPLRIPAPLDVPALINHNGSYDLMSDGAYSGQRFRVLNLIDEGVREALDIVVDTRSRRYELSGFWND